MTLRNLKIFIMVADTGSMTAASKALYMSQPTVSQAISELESFYGVRLFERLSKRLYITETGKQLLSYARHMAALYEEMEQTIRNSEKSGILKIGASITVGTYMLPKLVNEFMQVNPSLQIRAVVKNTKDIESLIVRNEVDFGIVEGAVHTPDILSSAFMNDEVILVCGKNHPFSKLSDIDPCDLDGQVFLVREEGSGTRELFENIMAMQEIQWIPGWECSGSDCLKSAAEKGIGIAVISKRLVEKELQCGSLYRIHVNGMDFKRKFSMIYHKNKFFTETMKSFFDLCYNRERVTEGVESR